MRAQGREMRESPIALVTRESICGILSVRLDHHTVSGYFCDDGGRRNAGAQRVAFHDGCLLCARQVGNAQPINQRYRWNDCRVQIQNRETHSAMGCLQDIDPVNLGWRDFTDANRNCLAAYSVVSSFALALGQFLRVPDAVQRKFHRQHDAGGEDTARERPAPHFVHARDHHMASVSSRSLKLPKIRFCASQVGAQRIGWIRLIGQKMKTARPTTRLSRSRPQLVPSLLSLRLSPIIRSSCRGIASGLDTLS